VTLTQPYSLNNKLREYQLIGLNWLVALNENKININLKDMDSSVQILSMYVLLLIN